MKNERQSQPTSSDSCPSFVSLTERAGSVFPLCTASQEGRQSCSSTASQADLQLSPTEQIHLTHASIPKLVLTRT